MKAPLQKKIFFNARALRISSKWPQLSENGTAPPGGGGQSGSIFALSKTAQPLENGTFGWHAG